MQISREILIERKQSSRDCVKYEGLEVVHLYMYLTMSRKNYEFSLNQNII